MISAAHASDLQSALDGHRDTLVGAAVARYDNGELSFATIGKPRIEGAAHVDASTKFKWGSLTKIITAFIVCQLADEGRLHLDDTLDKHLPAANLAAGDAIKIRQLLSHQAGLVDLFEPFDSPEAIVARLGAEGLIAPPGTLFSYTNSGYALLGALIHAITGKTWRENVAERVIERLGARTAVFQLAEEDANAARDYVFVEGMPTPAPMWPETGPYLEAAGSRFASGIVDASHILASLMVGRDVMKPAGAAMLSDARVHEMQSVQARLPEPNVLAKAWGLGWAVDPLAGTIQHMGGTSALALGAPSQGRLCVSLANTPNGAEIAQVELRKLLKLPPQIRLARVENADFQGVTGRYVSPLYSFDVAIEDDRLIARSPLLQRPVELIPVARRTFLARLASGSEGIETEVNFVGEGTPSHMHIALRALRRA